MLRGGKLLVTVFGMAVIVLGAGPAAALGDSSTGSSATGDVVGHGAGASAGQTFTVPAGTEHLPPFADDQRVQHRPRRQWRNEPHQGDHGRWGKSSDNDCAVHEPHDSRDCRSRPGHRLSEHHRYRRYQVCVLRGARHDCGSRQPGVQHLRRLRGRQRRLQAKPSCDVPLDSRYQQRYGFSRQLRRRRAQHDHSDFLPGAGQDRPADCLHRYAHRCRGGDPGER